MVTLLGGSFNAYPAMIIPQLTGPSTAPAMIIPVKPAMMIPVMSVTIMPVNFESLVVEVSVHGSVGVPLRPAMIMPSAFANVVPIKRIAATVAVASMFRTFFISLSPDVFSFPLTRRMCYYNARAIDMITKVLDCNVLIHSRLEPNATTGARIRGG
jgi:hypothetical protein